MTKEELAKFDRASEHAYECRCDDCELWWKMVPPEEDDYDPDEDIPF